MSRRRLLLIVCPLTAYVVALGVLAMTPASSITQRNIDRIEKGMTIEEVEAILGEATYHDRMSDQELWIREDGAAIILKIADREVINKIWADSIETPIEKLLRWLRLGPRYSINE